MQRYYENEYEKRIQKQQLIDANRSHHFQPYRGHVVAPDRYQKAYAQKGIILFCFKQLTLDTQLTLDLFVPFIIDNGGRSVLLARVLFDFNALSSREISVQKGDIVIVHRPIDHNWIEIEDSQSGLKVSN
jgi:SH3 domain